MAGRSRQLGLRCLHQRHQGAHEWLLLLALPRFLDEVESFAYDPDYGADPHLTLTGKKGKRDVVVEVYFEPFEDDQPHSVLDVNAGSWRHKQSDLD
jgi:hypothetical protein